MNFLNSLMLELRRQKIATPAFLLTLLAMIMLPLPPAVLDVLFFAVGGEQCLRSEGEGGEAGEYRAAFLVGLGHDGSLLRNRDGPWRRSCAACR
ncbi:hypothetical protein GCM10025794_10110 [Massilia kyonggiensis]